MSTYKNAAKPRRSKKRRKGTLIGNETPEEIVRRFTRTYDRLCSSGCINVLQPFRNELSDSMEKKSLLKKIVVVGRASEAGDDRASNKESIAPVIRAMKRERYVHSQLLCLVNVQLGNDEIILLAEMFERGIYPLIHFELMDCVFSKLFLPRLASSFCQCSTLTSIVLDYNELGDDGCRSLCAGLEENRTVELLSLNYCSIGRSSGQSIGQLVNNSAISSLYLDGNDLECEGVIALLSGCVRQAVLEAEERRMEADRLEEELILAAERERTRLYEFTPEDGSLIGEEKSNEAEEGKKKSTKGRRSKSKSRRVEPPPIGPWIQKLHIADNGIDSHRSGCSLLMLAVQSISGLVRYSRFLQELDVEENLIEERGGREILDSLQQRQLYGLPALTLRTTHRMSTQTFTDINKLSSQPINKRRPRRRDKRRK